MQYLKVGKGKYFTFFRPYHLWFLEAPISIAKAYFNKKVWLAPQDEPVADIMTVAKKDLAPGDVLERFGGYTCYGVMDLAEDARKSERAALRDQSGGKDDQAGEEGRDHHLG